MKALVALSIIQNPETLPIAVDTAFAFVAENTIIGDFDAVSLEIAVRLKEKKIFDAVHAIHVGDKRCVPFLRKAVSLGADEACYYDAEHHKIDGSVIAHLVADRARALKSRVIFVGKMSPDFENGQVGAVVAQCLGAYYFPQCVALDCDSELWKIDCDVDSVLIRYEIPVNTKKAIVIGTELRLAEPRFPSLPSIIRSKKVPVVSLEIGEIPTPTKLTQRLKNCENPIRRGAVPISPEGITELLERCR